MQTNAVTYDVLIIGAGINGLSTAYQLSKHKNLKVGVLEQFALGHSYGSSHGFSRVFRSFYEKPIYSKLAHYAKKVEWPLLEKEAGSQLLYPSSNCIFGFGPTFESNAQTYMKNCPDLEVIEIDAARRLFPHFRFSETPYVLQDRSVSAIAAKETMESLVKILIEKKIDILENTKVLKFDSTSDPLKVETTKGVLLSKRLVITAGPWVKQFIDFPICPIRQNVGYFQLKGAKKSYQLDQFPIWIYLGEGENEFFYGLPEFGVEGMKIAQHVTSGKMDDPDDKGDVDRENIRTLEAFISKHFKQPMVRLINVETCFYTNTPTEDFILSLLPRDPRIAIGSVCSGHAFKFAPLTGRILAELILNGKTTLAEFEQERELFSV